ncbi:hypothetical protein RUM44_007317 [Polyplax serrata]|uniref:Uncharacterized protein n=1 Tax=Polyplax serrata TaxID=468196 RepID=A0ABR1B0B9_POLSC
MDINPKMKLIVVYAFPLQVSQKEQQKEDGPHRMTCTRPEQNSATPKTWAAWTLHPWGTPLSILWSCSLTTCRIYDVKLEFENGAPERKEKTPTCAIVLCLGL